MKISRITRGDIKRFYSILYRKKFRTVKKLKKRKCQNYGRKQHRAYRINLLLDAGSLEQAVMGASIKEILTGLADRYCNHEVNYLGSGWVSLDYGTKATGMEGYVYDTKQKTADAYFEELYANIGHKEQLISQQIRTLLGDDYPYIQWNRDYKSGFSWKADYLDEVEAIHCPKGADIKTVWEVSRLEFLVQIALAAFFEKDNAVQRNQYITAYREIVYDFTACNPVGVGCCWIHAMEAGIRALNLLLSYSILKPIDESNLLDKTFDDIFTDEILLHGYYIWDNLEKGLFEKSGTNHYYSDVVGLLYVSCGLGCAKSNLLKKWRRFAVKEFIHESLEEFYPDGTNIECSTGYHCLMTELLVYGCALLERFQIPVPHDIKERVVCAGVFIEKITKQNRTMVQIGDNDSGRGVTVTETSLDKSETVAYCRGLYFQDKSIASSRELESVLVQAVSGRKPQEIPVEINYRQTRRMDVKRKYPVEKSLSFNYDCAGDKPEWGYFPDFGLYFYRQGNLNFYMYTGGDRGRKCEGHSHNDILHCEINIDGKDFTADSGTYVYINLDRKVLLRSRLGHFVPDYGIEPREMLSSWKYTGKEEAEVIELGEGKITVRYQAAGGIIDHERRVQIADGRIEILDRGMKEFKVVQIPCRWFSRGYGEIEERI